MSSFRSSEGVIDEIDLFLTDDRDKKELRISKLSQLSEFLNPTDLLIWLFDRNSENLTEIPKRINKNALDSSS